MGVPSRTAWLIAAGDTCRGRAAAGLPMKVSPVSRQTIGRIFEWRSLKNSGAGFGSSP